MLNIKYKKETLAKAQQVAHEYQASYEKEIKMVQRLHNEKKDAVETLKSVDAYIHSISSKPDTIDIEMTHINVRRQEFEQEVQKIQIESAKVEKISGSVAGVGAVTGMGIAMFGPTAAMAIATTFGTASTGTAIATLSGAAATNAALAWLGGGALAVGGGGVAAGEAFLAMAGPIGWTVGAALLIGSGIMLNEKNKKIADKAIEQTEKIKEETNKIKQLEVLTSNEYNTFKKLNEGVRETLRGLERRTCRDYRFFTDSMKDTLAQLINSALALSEELRKKIV